MRRFSLAFAAVLGCLAAVLISSAIAARAQIAVGASQPQDGKQSDDAKPTSAQEPDAIDFRRARALLQKRRQGEMLTADEAAYLQRAIEARRARQNQGDQPRRAAIEPRESTGLKPLSEMTADDRYEGEDGGLYGGGENSPPKEHREAAQRELARIEPLDAKGKPADDGRLVFISISMSNATQEFSLFKRLADRDDAKSPRLTIVDCAQGGQAMAEWAPPDAAPWREAERRIKAAGVTPEQVQVAWIKLANKSPSGDLARHGKKLQSDTLAVIQNAKSRFPNLRIVYLSSRIYGGYAVSRLNPEPYAYESAFVVRWLIQDQMKGEAELNFDAHRGAVKAPLLLWGPYLWADGTTPRADDKLVYTRDDLARDGTHPSPSGREKVAKLLLEFCKGDELAAPWFTGSAR